MTDDRQSILNFFANWQEASKRKDLPTLRGMMAEDVVFLRPNCPPMTGIDAFVAEFQTMQNGEFDLDIHDWRVEELRIEGDWAYCWTYLSLSLKPRATEGGARQMAGNILSILRKTGDGHWVLARDANMLSQVQG